MFEKYQGDVQFYIVYIREAHALDSRSPGAFSGTDEELIQDPINLVERGAVANKCVADLDLPMPALIDDMDDTAGGAYLAWPDRLYLVGKDGKVAYTGGRGPFFFSPGGLTNAIEKELGAR